MTSGMHIKGLEELDKKLGRLGALQWTKTTLALAGASIVKKVSKYPEKTEANAPKPTGRWYQRGFGRKSATGWTDATSEQLGQKWYQVTGPRRVTLGNIVSYAKYVHGEAQARFHGARGWLKLKETGEEMLPRITKRFQKEVDRVLRS